MGLDTFRGKQAIEFKLEALSTLRGPGAYMYVVDDTAIYIGASRKVIGRVLARNHDRREAFYGATSLLIFPCDSWAEAKELESCLIAECYPKLNMRNGAQKRAEKVCRALGVTPHHVITQYLTRPSA